MNTRKCRFCQDTIAKDHLGTWVDSTEGDVCATASNELDENVPHEPQLRVLDLFSGLHGWSAAFAAKGHHVVTLDIEERFGCTITADILEVSVEDLEQYGPFDIILASPPCEAFSVAALSRNWEVIDKATSKNPVVQPRSDKARLGEKLVEHTLALIHGLNPDAWLMENPRAMMRRLPILQDYPRHTVTYCKYGKSYMKPTDLWGSAVEFVDLIDPCKTRPSAKNPSAGQRVPVGDKTYVTDTDGHPCHESAPRGSKTGVQGLGSAEERAVVPYMLSLQVCEAMEERIK